MMSRDDGSSKTAPAGAIPPICIRIPEACRLTGIGRSKMYELIGAGEIEIIKVGTMTLVPMTALTEFIEALRRGQR